MDDIESYTALYAEWTQIDVFNLGDKAKQVPSQKQFWASRLIEAKREKLKLERLKKKLKTSVVDAMLKESPVKVTQKTLEQLDTSPQLENINEKIEDVEMLIQCLELIFKCVTFIAQDFKNIIDSAKLETGEF